MPAIRRLLFPLLTASFLVALASPAPAKTVWLCKPGLENDPCTPSLRTTRFSPSGANLGVQNVKAAKNPRIDCFYVYPTTSNQTTALATRTADPELKSIALYQAARFSRDCRVFAPVYRQITVSGLFTGGLNVANANIAYGDVRDAWNAYLDKYNKGRGVVLIGHSQGSFMLRRLITAEIDLKPSVRRRLVSSILLGGDVKVKQGKDAGGDFKKIPACRSRTQIGCVVAFSTYGTTPPANSLFGRSGGGIDAVWGIATKSGREVLCTNPAALGGGSGKANLVYPRQAFAPGAIGGLTNQLGLPRPTASTTWLEYVRAYRASCTSANGANVLQITPRASAPVLAPQPDPSWGLHLADANVALGTLTLLVRRQASAWVKKNDG